MGKKKRTDDTPKKRKKSKKSHKPVEMKNTPIRPRPKAVAAKRRCPECGAKVAWAKPKGPNPRVSDDPVKCNDGLNCGWIGMFFDTIPMPKKGKKKPELQADHYRDFLKGFHDVFAQMLDADTARVHFEEYLQNHNRGDPDEKGSQTQQRYIRVLGQIAMLRKFINIMGLGKYEEQIVEQEIRFLFPDRVSRPPQRRRIK